MTIRENTEGEYSGIEHTVRLKSIMFKSCLWTYFECFTDLLNEIFSLEKKYRYLNENPVCAKVDGWMFILHTVGVIFFIGS